MADDEVKAITTGGPLPGAMQDASGHLRRWPSCQCKAYCCTCQHSDRCRSLLCLIVHCAAAIGKRRPRIGEAMGSHQLAAVQGEPALRF